uniref:Uncharacterized protein n=1 Tax=Sphaerodactylus townsendi TaxID=933632 RepID=A0ACB8EPS9_9SAUR
MGEKKIYHDRRPHLLGFNGDSKGQSYYLSNTAKKVEQEGSSLMFMAYADEKTMTEYQVEPYWLRRPPDPVGLESRSTLCGHLQKWHCGAGMER